MEHKPIYNKKTIIKTKQITFGQKLAEIVANIVGSWKFIIMQSIILTLWIIFNVMPYFHYKWDGYPFILMNLFLSLQAAYTAPLILISSNRQAEKDRQVLYGDYRLDKKTNKILDDIYTELKAQNKKIESIMSLSVNKQPEK